jgi:hypothetical protein
MRRPSARFCRIGNPQTASRSRAASCSVVCGLGVRGSPHRAGCVRALSPVHTCTLGGALVKPRKKLVRACASSPEISWGGHGLLPTKNERLPTGKTAGSRSRGTYEVRVRGTPHGISGPKLARPHGGIPSPGAEQRRGQWVVSGQGFA